MTDNFEMIAVKKRASMKIVADDHVIKKMELFDEVKKRFITYSAVYSKVGDLYITQEETDGWTRRISYTFDCNKPEDFIFKVVSDKDILNNFFIDDDFVKNFIKSATKKLNFSASNLKKQTSVVFTDDGKPDGLSILFCPINFSSIGNMEYIVKLNITVSNRLETKLPSDILPPGWVIKLKNSFRNINVI